jgi:soluble cytochrome b562
MENTERKEALAAIDVIAAEIHAEYAKVGEQTGHKLPAWEDVPESAKAMPRTLARLMLSKMERVYLEASEKAKTAAKEEAAKTANPKETIGEKAAAFKDLAKYVEDAVSRVMTKSEELKAPNPFEEGIDNAIRKIAEKIAVDIMVADEELQEKLKQNIAETLRVGLFGDKEE